MWLWCLWFIWCIIGWKNQFLLLLFTLALRKTGNFFTATDVWMQCFRYQFSVYNEFCIWILVMQIQNKACISGLHDKGLFLLRDTFTILLSFLIGPFWSRGKTVWADIIMAVMIRCLLCSFFNLGQYVTGVESCRYSAEPVFEDLVSLVDSLKLW